jgi:CelD/BcsL family acetyltransferase involved in cellulose biosynthesis
VIRLAPDDPRWLRLASESPLATAFHHPAWIDLVAATYGYRAEVLARAGPEGELVAGLPAVAARGRWISLPFTDVCPPLGDPLPLLAEIAAAEDLQGLEIRAAAGVDGFAEGTVGVIHRLPLAPDPAETMRAFRRSHVRRNIAAAMRNEVAVRVAATAEDVTRVFYGLHWATRRRQGSPVQPRRFFELLWERVLARGPGVCLLAEHRGSPIAGAVFLEWNGTLTYKFGASDERFWRLRPNHLLFWRAIERASGLGLRVLDLGRSELGNTGLREFKSSWGAVEEPLVYSRLGGPAPSERSPTALRALGFVIRRTPPVVCRAVGEALYRYAA